MSDKIESIIGFSLFILMAIGIGSCMNNMLKEEQEMKTRFSGIVERVDYFPDTFHHLRKTLLYTEINKPPFEIESSEYLTIPLNKKINIYCNSVCNCKVVEEK